MVYKQATEGDNTTSQPWAVQLEAEPSGRLGTKIRFALLAKPVMTYQGYVKLLDDGDSSWEQSETMANYA